MTRGFRGETPVPYLEAPPAVIPIDVGRQLFVDDFLIARTTLQRSFHAAEKYSGNPVLRPETPYELRSLNCCTFDDAVFYDPKDRLFKMWYVIDYYTDKQVTALAYSEDGLKWTKPAFDVVKDSNIVLPLGQFGARDNFSPWLDHSARNPSERYKAYLVTRRRLEGKEAELINWLYTSPDGIHWNERTRFDIDGVDGTMLAYNPFRRKWILSMKTMAGKSRCRGYLEHDEFEGLARLGAKGAVYWTGASDRDRPDPDIGNPTQLYNLPLVAYESIMLGVFTIHYGPENPVCLRGRFPKLTQPKLGFSRDGFHWTRGDYSNLVSASKKAMASDRGYLRAAGGGCLVYGDRLLFYYCGFSGVSPSGERHMYGGGTTHVASLRRDGFASMDAGESGGELVTRPVAFRGKHLFVNVNCPAGRLQAEVLDEKDRPIAPFSLAKCVPVAADRTCAAVTWKGAPDLARLAGRAVKFRFAVTRGSLYAFWVSPEKSGASHGYVGAGGPGFTGPTDTVGSKA